jgi:hypothetical protein
MDGRGRWLDKVFIEQPSPPGLGNRTPMAVWREGVTGPLGATAVDMMLRLDNAGALPTCPQPHAAGERYPNSNTDRSATNPGSSFSDGVTAYPVEGGHRQDRPKY